MSRKLVFKDMIRVNKFCLQFFGILPLNGPLTTWKKRFSNFLSTLTLCCISCIMFPVFHYMISANLELDDTLDALNVIAGVLGGEFRMIFVALNRKKIQRLVSTCEVLWNDASPDDFKVIYDWANRARLLSVVLCSTTVVTVSFYVFLPIIKQIIPGAVIETRTWPYEVNMDSTQSPRYEIYYVFQSFCACVGTCSITGCDLVGPFLALYACGQLRLIQSWLSNISQEEAEPYERYIDERLEETFKKCIRRHKIVMDFCAALEEVVCYVNLAQALGGMYMLTISAARLTNVQNSGMHKSLGPLFLAIGQLFLSCWPVQDLFSESIMVTEAIYAAPWYSCSPRIRKAIVFMMARAQRPARLTAGKFATFSFETFSSIISAAVSGFMLLRSIDSCTSNSLLDVQKI